VLLSIAGPSDMTLHEVSTAAALISEHSDGDANIIFGAIIDEALGDEMRVTVVAAGFDRDRRSTGVSSAATATMPPLRRSQPGIGTREPVPAGAHEGTDEMEIPGFVQG
jgi:cell division protein FtsZ